MMVNEDNACTICRGVDSSIGLNKAGLDVPMLLLPLDLAPLVAGDKTLTVQAALSSTELVQNPWNVTSFSVEVTPSQPLLTPSLETRLNPLSVTIVAAEDLPNHSAYTLMGTWKDGANPRTRTNMEL
eukprot:CAMPEP_0174945076 /NCGR_PEP_ID=MMETSP1355-20121228/80651_1 /TAXON_ID=464990 /ORGANISM="Hemiselmis tepida, Strain CCMP443" /LENGTH=126 /DNA_ID=CAMNT_0016192431 /DNA_START=54 /DNA_END=430 /DNA_ORIENTATION=+